METSIANFRITTVDKDSTDSIILSRQGILQRIAQSDVAKVVIWAGDVKLKTYNCPAWAVKFMKYPPSRAVEIVVYTKGAFNRG